MELNYIKANGVVYRPQKPGVQDLTKREGCYLPVCRIKKLLFGRWQIDKYEPHAPNSRGKFFLDETEPNVRIIIYPSGIEEVSWLYYPE